MAPLTLDGYVAVGVVGIASLVLIVRMVRTVIPGWKYELRSGGKIVKVLDKPGLYFVSPFLSATRVRTEDNRLPN